MKEYEVWYSETITYKAWFHAKSDEAAKEMIKEIEWGTKDPDSLPEFDKTIKSVEYEFEQPEMIGETNEQL